ncbi:MAG: hypothetical protein RLZZ324_625 [Candidatus Parcubacteria bacterium]|jgi:hypothetical protein
MLIEGCICCHHHDHGTPVATRLTIITQRTVPPSGGNGTFLAYVKERPNTLSETGCREEVALGLLMLKLMHAFNGSAIMLTYVKFDPIYLGREESAP